MAWDGVDRRMDVVSFNGLERRAAARARVLASATRLPVEQMRELAYQRHREELESWEAAEYLE
jgi:hypothetical protein